MAIIAFSYCYAFICSTIILAETPKKQMVIAMYVNMHGDMQVPLYHPAYLYMQRLKYRDFSNLHAFSHALQEYSLTL